MVGISLLVLAALLSGCASVDTAKKTTELLWPAPPLTPRIKFVGEIRSQDDLGKSTEDLLLEGLVGKKKSKDALEQPMAVATTHDGKRLYVSDYLKRAVFVFDLAARKSSFLQAPTRPFKRPFGVAVSEKGDVYVVDSVLKVVLVFDAGGKLLRQITYPKLERPTGIAVDSKRGRIYVADSSEKKSMNHLVHVFDLNGKHLMAFGGKGVAKGKLYFPTYLALDKKGNVYVADTLNARVQVFDPEGKFLGIFGARGDGIGAFDKPKGVALDTFGNVYVVDSTWSNVQIFNQRKRTLLYFAGRGRIPGLLFNPTGITIDGKNRIYVADAFNSRIDIYQLINTTAKDSYLPMPEKKAEGGKKEEDGGQKEAKKAR